MDDTHYPMNKQRTTTLLPAQYGLGNERNAIDMPRMTEYALTMSRDLAADAAWHASIRKHGSSTSRLSFKTAFQADHKRNGENKDVCGNEHRRCGSVEEVDFALALDRRFGTISLKVGRSISILVGVL